MNQHQQQHLVTKPNQKYKDIPTDDLYEQFANSRVKDKETGVVLSYNVEMRNELAERNLKLVPFVIERFFKKVPQLASIREDLMQEGYVGLLDALPRFEPDLGFRFSTYSTYWVRQQIGHTLLGMTNGGAHIPTSIKVLLIKLQKEAKKMNKSFDDYLFGKEAFDLVASLPDGGVGPDSTRRKLENVLAASRAGQTVQLDAPMNYSGGWGHDEFSVGRRFNHNVKEKSLGDTLQDNTQESNEIEPDRFTVVRVVKEAVEKLLSTKERNVLFLRYGIVNKPFEKPSEPTTITTKKIKTVNNTKQRKVKSQQ